jgi:hypothetical protein
VTTTSRPEGRNRATTCCASATSTDLQKREFARFGATPLQAAQHPRNTLTCGNAGRATKRRNRARQPALGKPTRGQGLEPDHRHPVALRQVRETARPAPPVHGRQAGTRPDQAPRLGQVPALRPARTEPAHPHLHHPVGLQEAQGRRQAPGRGRETQAAPETRRRPQTGQGEGTPAAGGRETQAGRSRRSSRPQSAAAAAVTRPDAPRLRNLHGRPLPELPLPDLPGRPRGRQRRRPRRGSRRRLRRGLPARFRRRCRQVRRSP